jgi:hypothetical protein
MFIFDEMDKLPIQLLDAIIPFIDYYDRINGVDARKSIFLFLRFIFLSIYWSKNIGFFSNGGANVIAQKTLEYYNRGQPREDITFKELEEMTRISAFNEGLK